MIGPFEMWTDDTILKCMQEYAKWITDKLGYSQNRIILIKNKMANQYSDGKYLYNFDEQEYINRMNQILDKMYNILETLLPNCYVIDFIQGVYGDYFHKWGLFPLHFCTEYYDYLYECIDKISNKSIENNAAEKELYQKYSTIFTQQISELSNANQKNSITVLGKGKNYLTGSLCKTDATNLSLFYGHDKQISEGWKTIGNSTFVFLQKNSLILMDNGGSSSAQINIGQTLENYNELIGKPITLSVDARVLKRNDFGEGGLIAIANANSYNKGVFYAKKSFHNLEWKRITLSIQLPDKDNFNGITVVFRAIRGGWTQNCQNAIVEFANPKLEIGITSASIDNLEKYPHEEASKKNVGWNLNLHAVEEYQDSGIHEIENVFQAYKLPSYTILFRANGGLGDMDSIWGVYGEYMRLPKNKFVREGYRFIGWNGYRVSDSKYCYTKGKERRYLKKQEVSSGWKLHIYKDECVVAKLAHKANDTIIMEAQWEKIEDGVMGQTDLFLQRIDSTIKGYQIVKRIIEKEDPTEHYLILNRHIGDAMKDLKCAILFKNYYSLDDPYHVMGKAFPKNRHVKKVKVITNNLLSGIARLFSSVDEVITVSQEELNYIDCYVRSSSCVHKNLYRDEYSLVHDKAAEHNKVMMFGVSSYRWELDLPMELPAQNEWIISSIKIGKVSIENAYAVLKQHHITAEKAIILCPYAQSTSMLPVEYWINIVNGLKDYGYTIFTNVGPKEQELPGTLRLQVPVDTICGLGVLGSCIIGVQSGIMDTFRWVNANLKIIFISYLVNPQDAKIAQNRKIKERVEQRGNTTHVLINKGEEDQLQNLVIDSFLYIKKGNEQKQKYRLCASNSSSLFASENLNAYISEFLKMKNCILFMSVCDSANKYWTAFNSQRLGLQCDLSLKWRQSYIAIINSDGAIEHEAKRDNYKEIKYQFTFSDSEKNQREESVPCDNFAYVSSHAMGVGKYTKSAIIINGEQYSLNRRGLNIVVYSKEESRVIDSIVVDLWADPNLTVKREEDFK